MNHASEPRAAAPTLSPIRHEITVEASVQRAFQVFTEGFDRWWPRSHHIGKTEPVVFIVEGRVGGRCYERGTDGVECPWGVIRAWEPPSRLVIAWHLNGKWEFDPEASRASEVEIRFIQEGAQRTRVELEHRHIERHGEGAENIHKGVNGEGGWPGILAGYGKVASAS